MNEHEIRLASTRAARDMVQSEIDHLEKRFKEAVESHVAGVRRERLMATYTLCPLLLRGVTVFTEDNALTGMRTGDPKPLLIAQEQLADAVSMLIDTAGRIGEEVREILEEDNGAEGLYGGEGLT